MATKKKDPGKVLSDLFPAGLGELSIVGEASPREQLRAILEAAKKCGGSVSAPALRAFARGQRQIADAAEEMAKDIERQGSARLDRILEEVNRPFSIKDYLRGEEDGQP